MSPAANEFPVTFSTQGLAFVTPEIASGVCVTSEPFEMTRM